MRERPPRKNTVLAVAIFAVVYAVVGKLGLSLDAVSGFASLVWPPTGLALFALLTYGFRVLPGVFLGAWVVNVWAGAPLGVALGIAVGNSLEAALGAYALRRATGSRGTLECLDDVIVLIAAAALASTLVSATFGVLSLRLGSIVQNAGQAAETWRAWWLGDALGDLVVAPLLLTWSRRGARLRLKANRALEAVALLVLATLASCSVFLGPPRSVNPLASPYILFPLFVWASLRFQLRGGTLAVALVSALAIWGTVRGAGPFADGGLSESLFALQAYMGCASITALIVAGVTVDRASAIRAQETFMATVSHDLKNPLNALTMSSQVLLRKVPNESVRAHHELLKRTVDRMMRLIHDLLDVSAIERGRLALEPRPEDTRAMVSEALDMLRPLAAAKRVTFDATGLESIEVFCDRDRTLQVFSNIIGNAIKFCPEGSSIRVGTNRAEHAAHFFFQDQGPGIAPGELRHVFERYRHARPSAGGGSGLGLFIAKGIVEAQGGRIWVESKLGAGSTFHLTLPMGGPVRRAIVGGVRRPLRL